MRLSAPIPLKYAQAVSDVYAYAFITSKHFRYLVNEAIKP